MELIPSYNETYPIMELILLSRWERLNLLEPRSWCYNDKERGRRGTDRESEAVVVEDDKNRS